MQRSLPNIILHFEGLELFLMSLFVFHWFHGNWWMFAALVLLPDIGMLGYVWGAKVGSVVYNISHTATFPAAFLLVYWTMHHDTHFVIPLLAIWTAHIGIDRFLGYGLKYPTHFKDTHLQRV